jgi:enamine deaminase RidA (YjgF/YER057c/UK114 family)
MPRQIITTANAPGSPFYSQGVKAGPHALVSGIAGIDPSTGSLAGDTIQAQTRRALTNREAILRADGASLSLDWTWRAYAGACWEDVEHQAARRSRTVRSGMFLVSEAARRNSAAASSRRPSLARRSPRTLGRWW